MNDMKLSGFKRLIWGGVILSLAIPLFVLLFKYLALKQTLQASLENGDYYSVIGWTNTMEKLNYKADVCFFGNSLTCYSNFQKDFPSKKIVILGYPGQGLIGMIKRSNQISAVHPDKIFLMAGINDLNLNKMSFDEFCGYYEQLVDSILSSNNHADVFLQSILPVNHSINLLHPNTEIIVKANDFIKKLASRKRLTYIDLYNLYSDEKGELKKQLTSDGIHLKETAYHIWSSKIQLYIE